LKTAYFPIVACISLCIDLFISVLSLLALSARAVNLQHFTRKQLLADFRTEDA